MIRLTMKYYLIYELLELNRIQKLLSYIITNKKQKINNRLTC